MNVEEQSISVRATWLDQHRYFGLIIAAIVTTCVLVTVAMSLYNSSGAAQLDLSRPGYQNVRKDVVTDRDTSTYPASGSFDREALDQFAELYDKRAKKVLIEGVYDPAALSDDSLQLLTISEHAETQQAPSTE